MQKPPRPTGITIIAILEFIVGVRAILSGAYIGVIGGFAVVIGLLAVVVGWGMWSGKGWAWILAVMLYSLGIPFSVGSLLGGSPSALFILPGAILLLWYLFRPNVKAYFGWGLRTMQQTPPTTAT